MACIAGSSPISAPIPAPTCLRCSHPSYHGTPECGALSCRREAGAQRVAQWTCWKHRHWSVSRQAALPSLRGRNWLAPSSACHTVWLGRWREDINTYSPKQDIGTGPCRARKIYAIQNPALPGRGSGAKLTTLCRTDVLWLSISRCKLKERERVMKMNPSKNLWQVP